MDFPSKSRWMTSPTDDILVHKANGKYGAQRRTVLLRPFIKLLALVRLGEYSQMAEDEIRRRARGEFPSPRPLDLADNNDEAPKQNEPGNSGSKHE